MVDENSLRNLEPGRITPEDQELLDAPDEELRERTGAFSFDAKRCRARISAGDRWQQLLQAHLYFDHVVSRLLLEALAKPEAINASRMGFLQKLQLIQALGLLPPEVCSPVEFMNSLRNK